MGVPPSRTTRQLRTPPSAASRRAVSRATGSAGTGAGRDAARAVPGGDVGGGGGRVVASGAIVEVVVDVGTDRTRAAERAGEGCSTSAAPEAMISAAMRTARPRTAQEIRPPPTASRIRVRPGGADA